MEKDTKRVWHLPYCFLEPGELERKFARLAAQGWLLEKCTYGTYTYRRGEPNEYEYRVQYIYESRDGQRTDYVKTLGHGRREGRRYGFIPCTAQESGRCAVYALF